MNSFIIALIIIGAVVVFIATLAGIFIGISMSQTIIREKLLDKLEESRGTNDGKFWGLNEAINTVDRLIQK